MTVCRFPLWGISHLKVTYSYFSLKLNKDSLDSIQNRDSHLSGNISIKDIIRYQMYYAYFRIGKLSVLYHELD